MNKLQQDRAAGRSQLPNINLNGQARGEIIAFLQTLTDPCLATPSCIAAWIPPRDGGPDGQQLDAIGQGGNPLQ